MNKPDLINALAGAKYDICKTIKKLDTVHPLAQYKLNLILIDLQKFEDSYYFNERETNLRKIIQDLYKTMPVTEVRRLIEDELETLEQFIQSAG